jgi:holo-[acyl-carrier protein] synthase
MTVVAIGNDLVEVARVREVQERHPERFLRKVFTAEERRYSLARFNPAMHLAARFAVKEAVMKVLGTGRAVGVAWKDIGVIRTGGQRPYVILEGRARERALRMGIERIHVTISHTDHHALATAVGEGPGDGDERGRIG